MTSRRREQPLPQYTAAGYDDERINDSPYPLTHGNDEEGQQQTTAVKQIMAQCVAKQSSGKYAGQNAGFAMYCLIQSSSVITYWSHGSSRGLVTSSDQLTERDMQKNAA
jgi:hypothetical protein